MEANILSTKIELIQWLTTLEDKTVIQKLLEFRKREAKDWSNEEEERISVEKGLKDAKNGNLKPHSEAQKIYGKWL